MFVARSYDPKDEAALVELWHESWHVAHASLVPAELLPLRSLEYFRKSFPVIAPYSRVLGPVGAPFGFYTLLVNYVDRLFVGTRGQGHGKVLLKDAENEIRKNGFATGELDCLVGNDPAKAFYEAQGWVLCGERTIDIRALNNGATLNDWIYCKDL